jgi:hypothetical protein
MQRKLDQSRSDLVATPHTGEFTVQTFQRPSDRPHDFWIDAEVGISARNVMEVSAGDVTACVLRPPDGALRLCSNVVDEFVPALYVAKQVREPR